MPSSIKHFPQINGLQKLEKNTQHTQAFIRSDTVTLNFLGPKSDNYYISDKKFNTCILSKPFWVPIKTINTLLMPTFEGLALDNYNTNYQFFGPFWVQIVTTNT